MLVMVECFKRSRWTGMRPAIRTRVAFSSSELNCPPGRRYSGKICERSNSTKNCANMILQIFLGGLLAVSVVRAQSPSPDNQDQAALIALENEWLANLHNPAVLEKIIASDLCIRFRPAIS